MTGLILSCPPQNRHADTSLLVPASQAGRSPRSSAATGRGGSGAFVLRRVCRDGAADIGGRDAQDLGVLVLEHEERAIPIVPPDSGQGLGRAILERDLVRLCCHTDHLRSPFTLIGTRVLSTGFPATPSSRRQVASYWM